MAYKNKYEKAKENLCLRVDIKIIADIKKISEERFIGQSKIIERCLTTSTTLQELLNEKTNE